MNLRKTWFWCILLLGCNDLSSFEEPAGYIGDVAGNNADGCVNGRESCSFIRRGFSNDTQLQIQYTPSNAEQPGTLTTSGDPCTQVFDATPLLPIAALAHDSLSQFSFPGEGRLRNEMYIARPASGPLANKDVMVFVSLLRSDDLEVRILSGPGTVSCDPRDCGPLDRGECDYFGIFQVMPFQ